MFFHRIDISTISIGIEIHIKKQKNIAKMPCFRGAIRYIFYVLEYFRSILGVKKGRYLQALFISFTIFSMLLSDIPL